MASVTIAVDADGKSIIKQNSNYDGDRTQIEEVIPKADNKTIDILLKPSSTKVLAIQSNVNLSLVAGGDSLDLKAGVPYLFRHDGYEQNFITADRTSITATNADTENDATLSIYHEFDAVAA